MKKFRTLFIIIIVMVALALLKIFVVDAGKVTAAGGQGKAQPPSPVTVAVVNPTNYASDIILTGDIIANEEVVLHAEVSGKITAINFTEGSQVSKGQLLVKINDADLQANLRKLKAQLVIANEKKDRLDKLLKVNGVSREDYDVAVNAVQDIEADIDYTKAQIAKTEIYAPFDGVVGLKNVSQGGYITPADAIATVQQLKPLKIDFSVPERYASLVSKQSAVNFSTGTGSANLQAKVYAIEPKIDPTTRTLRVRALYTNADGKVFPGAFAQIKLAVTEAVPSFLVPTQALIPGVRGQKAFVVQQGKAKQVDVQTGMRNDSTIQILGGLNPGDSLVVTGVMVLRDGSALSIKPNAKK